MEELAIKNRIKLLEGRNTDNGRIVKKLKRRLLRLNDKAAKDTTVDQEKSAEN